MQITDIFKLLGGVGLFLFGMSIMSTGLKNACGDNLQNILECATKNKVVAVFAGLLMTCFAFNGNVKRYIACNI